MPTPSQNLTTNQGNVTESSTFNTDKVIYSGITTLTVNNTVSTTAQSFTISTNINQYGRPLGIYSTDGKVTWNDLGATSQSTSSVLNNASKPALFVSPYVAYTGIITIYVTVNSLIGAGSTFPLVVAICLLSTDRPGTLPALPVLAGNIARGSVTSSGKALNYRQIQIANIYTMPSTTPPPYYVTVAHNLGYIPTINCWNNNGASADPNYLQGTLYAAGGAAVLMDDTNLYFTFFILGAEYIYRLYQA